MCTSSSTPEKEALFLFDASGFIYRAFYALPPLSSPEGENVGAVFGFANMLLKIIDAYNPPRIGVVFDVKDPTFRHTLFPDYKAHRKDAPDDLVTQIPLVADLCRAFSLPMLSVPGFEADDVMASYARSAQKLNISVTLASSDKDLSQLLAPNIFLLDPLKNKPITPEEIFKKWGVTPQQFIDFQALTGDPSDNIPGVPGIGPKTAAQLLTQAQTLDALYTDLESVSRPRLRALLAEHKDQAFLSRDLARLRTDIPLPTPFDRLACPRWRENPDQAAAALSFCREKGFRRLIDRFADCLPSSHRLSHKTEESTLKSEKGMAKSEDKSANLSNPLSPPLSQISSETPLLSPSETPLLSLSETCSSSLPKNLPPEANLNKNSSPMRLEGVHTLLRHTDTNFGKKLGAFLSQALQTGRVFLTLHTRTLPNEAQNEDTSQKALLDTAPPLPKKSRRKAVKRPFLLLLTHSPARKGMLSLQALSLIDPDPQTLTPYLDPIFDDTSTLKIFTNAQDLFRMLRPRRMTHFDDLLTLAYLAHGPSAGKDLDTFCTFFKDSAPETPAFSMYDLHFSAENKPPDDIGDLLQINLTLWPHLKTRILDRKMAQLYQIDRALIPVLSRLESTGITVNIAKLKKAETQFSRALSDLESQIHALAGRPFLVSSPKQLGEILFQDLGAGAGKKGKSGAFHTDNTVLEALAYGKHEDNEGENAADRAPSETICSSLSPEAVASLSNTQRVQHLAKIVLEWRKLAKLSTTYAQGLLKAQNPQTGRVHTNLNATLTATGRLSSTQPNLQNIPIRTQDGHLIRAALEAAPGMTLLSLDYSQIELRFLAHMGPVPEMQAAFHAGTDIHARTASDLFDVPLNAITPDMRRQAKTINFGIIYGISAFGLSSRAHLGRLASQDLIDRYFKTYPGISAYMDRFKRQARTCGFVTTLWGRRCVIPDILARNIFRRQAAERQAINAPLQGANADLMRRVMTKIEALITHEAPPSSSLHKSLGKALGEPSAPHVSYARLLLQIHDELLFEVPHANLIPTAQILKTVMESAATLSVPLQVDARAGPNWSDLRPLILS